MQTTEIVGVEALVRWQNEKLGFVSPAEFIPYAEETGLIIPISLIIFEKACEGYKQLAEAVFRRCRLRLTYRAFISNNKTSWTRYNQYQRKTMLRLKTLKLK